VQLNLSYYHRHPEPIDTPGTQLPFTALQLPVAPHVTRGAALLPAVKLVLQVAVQVVPTVLLLEQLNVAFAGLAGLKEHTTAPRMRQTAQKSFGVRPDRRYPAPFAPSAFNIRKARQVPSEKAYSSMRPLSLHARLCNCACACGCQHAFLQSSSQACPIAQHSMRPLLSKCCCLSCLHSHTHNLWEFGAAQLCHARFKKMQTAAVATGRTW
jgi:hypothetical protein